MEAWITEWMNQFGYFGVFLLILLENVFPPIPSEVILTLGGFMTTSTSMTKLGVILAATAGSVIGAAILYGIGLLLDVERLEKIVKKYGKFLRLTVKDIHKADAWFDKYGVWAVFFGRLIPLVRSLISIPAGMSNMKFWLFLLFTTLGTLIWNTILVSVGSAVGENWEDIVGYMDIYSNVVYIILAIVGIAFLVWYFKKRD
ncbi:DedA family protein [Psychrobacillus sp. FSL K6-2684]|uniref:DedA family protein n=1 Tax=Psychrobacillus faecigallinarum TaxID=2762235 RepID=A0ABR8RA57_9BACI|nr:MULTISPECIES: DedA family protein [Psychrobacillus]MBD7944679.1 DedA family protein [Psychrobacillus faecigallinarum]QEY21200.1 DedA family protein [Psychrobacillus sp. AK 1817]QGM31717.1 DedA family protein [Bacillus sp. N3536]